MYTDGGKHLKGTKEGGGSSKSPPRTNFKSNVTFYSEGEHCIEIH